MEQNPKELTALKTINAAYDDAIVKSNAGVFDKVVEKAASEVAEQHAATLTTAFKKLEEAKKTFEAFKPDNEATYKADGVTVAIEASYSKKLSQERKAAYDKWSHLDKAIMACFELRNKENCTANDVRDAYKKLAELVK